MSDSSKGASSMAELLAKHADAFQPLVKGQTVSGTVTKANSTEIIMDLNGKTEAFIIEKDRRLLRQLLSLIHVGDKVEAMVISSESEMGYPIVSLRRFVEGQIWEQLEKIQKSGEKVTVNVLELTRGGYLVETENGISGFLPNSHVGANQKPEEMVGHKIKASIVELVREARKVVFSQKGVLTDDDFKRVQTLYKNGSKVKGFVSGITPFGVFVSLPFAQSADKEERYIDGLIHISEVAWDKVEDLSERFAMGDEVEAVVIGTDRDSKRVDLSVKRLTADPFQAVLDAFPVDKKVSGTVTEVNDNGVMLDLGAVSDVQVEGMIKKDKIPPTTKYEIGETVKATVTQVDAKRRRVMLTPILLEKPLMYR